MAIDRLPWVVTPCPESKFMSNAAGCTIYTKLEHLQPSGSFKSRGIGNLVLQTVKANQAHGSVSPIHFYSCSAGNAGLAAATASRQMGQQACVVVPDTTSILMQEMIGQAGAKVIVHGSCIAESDELVRKLVANDPLGVYVSPYNHENIWAGNATLMDELYEQLQGVAPDAIVCSVGGGGLLNGILLGLIKYKWDKTTVLAMETTGADSMNQSLLSGHVITLPKVTSIAKSLGVSRISDKTWELMHERNEMARQRGDGKGFVQSIVLQDAEAAMACVRFADQEGIIIEPACGVSVVGAYNGLFARVVPDFNKDSRIAVVVCGGSTVNMKNLLEYEKEYESRISWKH